MDCQLVAGHEPPSFERPALGLDHHRTSAHRTSDPVGIEADDTQDPQVAVAERHVDGKAHTDGVHRTSRPQQQGTVEPIPSEQAAQPGAKGIRNLQRGQHRRVPHQPRHRRTAYRRAVEPLEALERVVYLLDRGLAPAPKVKAFARATEIVAALDPLEVAARAEAGTLGELAGIGPSTGGVIVGAYRGKVPDYLAWLEAETVVPIGPGSDLRRALRGDCHSHTTWSDGGASIEAMGRAARVLGHRYLVITDHSPRMAVSRGLHAERLAQQRVELDAVNIVFAAEHAVGGPAFRLLHGLEVDINEDGSLDMDDDTLAGLDLVVASPHIKLRMEPRAMTRRLALAALHPHVDVLGHCTGRKVPPHGNRAGAEFDADLVFAACAEHGTAVEINTRPERQDPPEEILHLALEWGCKLAIDSDAHAPGQLEWVNYGCDKAALAGADPDDVINTWDVDRLVAWGRAR